MMYLYDEEIDDNWCPRCGLPDGVCECTDSELLYDGYDDTSVGIPPDDIDE